MAEPVRIKLSAHQLARFQAFNAESQAINQRVNDTVTAIVLGELDPASLTGWDIRLDGDAILCTPPESAKPQLVKDIGPDGVSESAATA